MRTKIKQLFAKSAEYADKEVEIYGWVRTNRAQAQFGFLNVNDGSFFESLQVVYDSALENFSDISKYRVGVSVHIKGIVKLTPDMKQALELHASSVEMLVIVLRIIQFSQSVILVSSYVRLLTYVLVLTYLVLYLESVV